METDPLTGQPVEVLWLKGSGGDLRTAKGDGFASLYLDKVRAMKLRYLASPELGPKTPIEDEMYPTYSHCVFNLNPRACSIDTPLGIIDGTARYIEAHDKGDQTFGVQKYQPLSEVDRQRLQAGIIPYLRGQFSVSRRFVGTVQDDVKMLRFVNSNDGPRLAGL